MVILPTISKVVKPKGHQVANFEKTVAQVSFSCIILHEQKKMRTADNLMYLLYFLYHLGYHRLRTVYRPKAATQGITNLRCQTNICR